MPFALNESTRFISPTKTPEFLAAGVPVVSTPIADVVRPYGEKGLVEIARDAAEVVAQGRGCCWRVPSEPWLARGRPAPRRRVLGPDLGGDARLMIERRPRARPRAPARAGRRRRTAAE